MLEKVMGSPCKSVNKLIHETIKSITIGSIVSSGFSINSELLERALISNSSLSQFNRILLLSQKIVTTKRHLFIATIFQKGTFAPYLPKYSLTASTIASLISF